MKRAETFFIVKRRQGRKAWLCEATLGGTRRMAINAYLSHTDEGEPWETLEGHWRSEKADEKARGGSLSVVRVEVREVAKRGKGVAIHGQG